MDKPDLPELISELHKVLPADCVLHAAEDLAPYECDGLSAYQSLPMLVVIPETIEQIESILHLCTEKNIPVVARGAGTGLSGGALPL